MSSKRSEKVSISVPDSVSSKFKSLKKIIETCPLAYLYLILTILMTGYYAIFLPDVKLKVKNDNSLDGTTVTGTMRAILVICTLVTGAIGFWLIKRGCAQVGSGGWSILWFLVAGVFSSIVTQIVFAAAEKTTIANGSSILRQLSGGKIKA